MSYRHLSLEERCLFTAWRMEGVGMVEISERLGRHRSTLWRELKRNRSRHDGGLPGASGAGAHAGAAQAQPAQPTL